MPSGTFCMPRNWNTRTNTAGAMTKDETSEKDAKDPKHLKACEKSQEVPKGRACGVCPPCPAPCSVDPPPTEAELKVKTLAVKLEQTQDHFKRKITECAMLRSEAQTRREEAERERGAARDTAARLRELEARFDALSEHAHALLRNKEQTLEQAGAVRALQQCYREARDEEDELRALLADRAGELKDYRDKMQQAQALVEEQKKQMAALELDNTRIADQINLEIQSIKVKFQERLAELSPLPEQLATAQRRLHAAQLAAGLARHAAAHTARHLDTARDRVNTLITHSKLKPPERAAERGNEERMLAMTQQRVTQLTEMSAALKGEIERQKGNVLRLEDALATCEKRVQEKMHECAALGGELDRAREDAALAVRRARDHEDTIRKCMETTVGNMKRELQEVHRQLEVAEKDRLSTMCRMQCQLQRLQQNFEVAEMRSAGLLAQAAALRAGGDDAPDEEPEHCTCQFDG